jgi:lipopolysaccharide biosynthesis glycosyltransferase
VWSLLRHHPGWELEAGFHVVAASDAVALAGEVLGELAREAGVKIDVIDAAELVPDEAVLRRDFGLFTPGHRLSAAAYYRLFAVRHLLASTTTRRVLYLDSDTCLGPGIDGLLRFDLEGQPLAARSEQEYGLRFESRRAIIHQAARNLGVDPSSYFNSGVLVFDGAHPDAHHGLDRAIQLSLHEPERLMFHDQCALNLAFAGQVTPLPAPCNRFVRPQGATLRDAPVVLHYLEQPKPWDPLYPTLSCRRWYLELVALGSVLAPGAIARLLREQFPPVSDSRTGAWSSEAGG